MIKKQSKHDVFCLFSFFLNQHCQNHEQKQETVSKRKQEIIAKTSPIYLLIFTRAFFLAVNALQRSPTRAIIRYSQSPVLGPLSYLLQAIIGFCCALAELLLPQIPTALPSLNCHLAHDPEKGIPRPPHVHSNQLCFYLLVSNCQGLPPNDL